MEALLYKLLVIAADSGIYAMVALGLGVAFQVVRFPDLTAEGSFVFGAVAAYLAGGSGMSLPLVLVICTIAGTFCGWITAGMHVLVRVPGILAGILTWMGLYSLNLRLLGSPNERLPAAQMLAPFAYDHNLVSVGLVIAASVGATLVVGVGSLCCFLESRSGLRLRCASANPYMATSLGFRTALYPFLGLGVANGLIGLAGGLFASKAGYVDVNMGAGILVGGIAPLFMGRAFFPNSRTSSLVAACLVGALLYRSIIALALEVGLDPRDLRLLTTMLVVLGLLLARLKGRPLAGLALESMLRK